MASRYSGLEAARSGEEDTGLENGSRYMTSGAVTSGCCARWARPGPGSILDAGMVGPGPQIEHVTSWFAGEGLVALAPDLYRSKITKSPDEAGKLVTSVRVDEAERDLAAAIDALIKLPETSGARVAPIGFCMGGTLSLFAASRNPEVDACVVSCDIHPTIKPDFRAVQAPVLGVFGRKGAMTRPQVVAERDQQLSELGKPHTFQTYAASTHAFFNEEYHEVYDPAAARDAWDRRLAFLRRKLGA